MASTEGTAAVAIDHDDPFIRYRDDKNNLVYMQYDPAREEYFLPAMRQLISKDLSEPYSIYVYRYFLYQWPDLCFLCLSATTHAPVGAILSKLSPHNSGPLRGYIAMISVTSGQRSLGVGSRLVRLALDAMLARGADEVALETEMSNEASLRLYQSLGFLRTKRLARYYLNGNDAYRLVLYLKPGVAWVRTVKEGYEDVPVDRGEEGAGREDAHAVGSVQMTG